MSRPLIDKRHHKAQLSISIDPHVTEKARKIAFGSGISLSQLFERAMSDYIRELERIAAEEN